MEEHPTFSREFRKAERRRQAVSVSLPIATPAPDTYSWDIVEYAISKAVRRMCPTVPGLEKHYGGLAPWQQDHTDAAVDGAGLQNWVKRGRISMTGSRWQLHPR